MASRPCKVVLVAADVLALLGPERRDCLGVTTCSRNFHERLADLGRYRLRGRRGGSSHLAAFGCSFAGSAAGLVRLGGRPLRCGTDADDQEADGQDGQRD